VSAGAPPQNPLESLQRSPGSVAEFKGPTSKGRQGEGERKGRKRKGRGNGTEGKGEENDLTHPLSQIPGYATGRGRKVVS